MEQGTRERLLSAAAELIGEVGWNAVTTRMVADRAGVASGVVHYHFSSVSDLLVEASTRVAAALLAETAAQLRARADLDVLLGQLATYDGRDPASLLMAEMYLAATRLPDLRERIRDMIVGFRAEVAEWLRQLGHTGDPAAAAVLITAAIDGLILHRGIDPELDLGPLAVLLRTIVEGSR